MGYKDVEEFVVRKKFGNSKNGFICFLYFGSETTKKGRINERSIKKMTKARIALVISLSLKPNDD
ncbi:hypothetical protein JNUCC74_03840 [Cerasibacillus sp. JNUCC 74]